MSRWVTISLDAMGGDHAPPVAIEAASLALRRCSNLRFVIFGDEACIGPCLRKYPELERVSRLVHTDVVVAMEDKPSQALRRGRRTSSMWMAVDAVRKGEADAAVSAGNTGALMAMSHFCLRTLPGIDRPALAGIWPDSVNGRRVMLDLGANVRANARQLVTFALMGEAMSRALFGIKRPKVGLMNIGVEEMKGLDEVQAAHRILKGLDLPMQYVGFIEGGVLGRGGVDVIVMEGFSGNIALKAAEGVFQQFISALSLAFERRAFGWFMRLLRPWVIRGVLRRLGDIRMGAVFAGLNGVVAKGHGGADAESFASAIRLAYDMVRNGLLEKIEQDLIRCARELDGAGGDDFAPQDQQGVSVGSAAS